MNFNRYYVRILVFLLVKFSFYILKLKYLVWVTKTNKKTGKSEARLLAVTASVCSAVVVAGSGSAATARFGTTLWCSTLPLTPIAKGTSARARLLAVLLVSSISTASWVCAFLATSSCQAAASSSLAPTAR